MLLWTLGQYTSVLALTVILLLILRIFRDLVEDMAEAIGGPPDGGPPDEGPPDFGGLLDGDDPQLQISHEDQNLENLLDDDEDQDTVMEDGEGGEKDKPPPASVSGASLPSLQGQEQVQVPGQGDPLVNHNDALLGTQGGPVGDQRIVNVSGASTPASVGGSGSLTPAAPPVLPGQVEDSAVSQPVPPAARHADPAVAQSQGVGLVEELLEGMQRLIVEDRRANRGQPTVTLEKMAEEYRQAPRGDIKRPLRVLFYFIRTTEIIWTLLVANIRAFSAFLCLIDREMAEEPLSFTRFGPEGPDGLRPCCSKLKATLEAGKDPPERRPEAADRRDQGRNDRKRNHNDSNSKRDQSQQRGRGNNNGGRQRDGGRSRSRQRDGGRSRSRSRSPSSRRQGRWRARSRSRSRSRDRHARQNQINPTYSQPDGRAAPVQTFYGHAAPQQEGDRYVVTHNQMMMPPPALAPALIQQMPGSSGTQAPAVAYPPGMGPQGHPGNLQERLQAMATEPRDSQPQGQAHWHQLRPLGHGSQVPQQLLQQQAPQPVVMQPGVVRSGLQPLDPEPVDLQNAQHQRTRAGQTRAEHVPPPPPPMTPAAASSSNATRGGASKEPTPQEAKLLQTREREQRAAARAAMQGQARADQLPPPPAGMSNQQRDAIAAYMMSDHYKGLAAGMPPEMREAPIIDLYSGPDDEEDDEDYRPKSSSKKRR